MRFMAWFALLGVATATAACRTTGDAAPALDPVALVGNWQPTEAAGGVIGLEFLEDGTYEALILASMGPDGCGTVVGNGVSQGTWVLESGVVFLRPGHETPDLVLTFEGARAVPGGDGLDLLLGPERYPFRALGPSPY